jgi:hypothetical protein
MITGKTKSRYVNLYLAYKIYFFTVTIFPTNSVCWINMFILFIGKVVDIIFSDKKKQSFPINSHFKFLVRVTAK